ncbi:MAG: hypothetical protein ABEH81_01135 [Halopenitus sp.]
MSGSEMGTKGMSGMSMWNIHNNIPTRRPDIFDDISKQKTMASFRMPMTYPAREVNGWMASGFPQPEDPEETATYGIDLPQKYNDMLPFRGPYDGDGIDIEERKEETWYMVDLFLDLIEDEDVVFFGSQFPDHMGHVYNKRKVESEYNMVQQFRDSDLCDLGVEFGMAIAQTLIQKSNHEDFAIISDHGYQTSGHSDYSTLITNLDGSQVDSIRDLRDFFTDALGISKATREYGETLEVDDDVEEQLESWGYK